MATYDIISKETGNSYRINFENPPTDEDVDFAAKHADENQPTFLGAAGRSALRGVVPAFVGGRLVGMGGAALGGALEGALAGSEFPVVGNIIGGLVGAGAGMWAFGKGQEKLADTVAPESIFSAASQQADYAAQPLASEIGGLGIFKPNPMKTARFLTGVLSQEGRTLVGEGFQLAKAGTAAATAREAQALKAFNDVSRVAGNIGIGAGMGAVQGEDLQSVLKSAGIGALFNDEWLNRHTTPIHEVSEHPAAEGKSYPRLGYTPETEPPIVTPQTSASARAAELTKPLADPEWQRLDMLRKARANWPLNQGAAFDQELADLEARARLGIGPPAAQVDASDPAAAFKAAMEEVKGKIPSISQPLVPNLNPLGTRPNLNPEVFPLAPERSITATEQLAGLGTPRQYTPEERERAAQLRSEINPSAERATDEQLDADIAAEEAGASGAPQPSGLSREQFLAFEQGRRQFLERQVAPSAEGSASAIDRALAEQERTRQSAVGSDALAEDLANWEKRGRMIRSGKLRQISDQVKSIAGVSLSQLRAKTPPPRVESPNLIRQFEEVENQNLVFAEKVRKAQEAAKAAQQNPDTQATGLALEEKLPELVKEQFSEQQSKLSELELKRQSELDKAAEKARNEKEQQAKQEDATPKEPKQESIPSQPEGGTPRGKEPEASPSDSLLRPAEVSPPKDTEIAPVATQSNAAASEPPLAPTELPKPTTLPEAPESPRTAILPDGRTFTKDGEGWRNDRTKRKVTNPKLITQLDELSQANDTAKPLEPPPPTEPAQAPTPEAVAPKAVGFQDFLREQTSGKWTETEYEAAQRYHDSGEVDDTLFPIGSTKKKILLNRAQEFLEQGMTPEQKAAADEADRLAEEKLKAQEKEDEALSKDETQKVETPKELDQAKDEPPTEAKEPEKPEDITDDTRLYGGIPLFDPHLIGKTARDAYAIAKDFAGWSREMISKLGRGIYEHLQRIWTAFKSILPNERGSIGSKSTEEIAKTRAYQEPLKGDNGDDPLEGKAEVPAFSSKFDKETFLQKPAWVKPGSAFDKVLGDIREKNDQFHAVDVQGIWKSLTPAQRQDLAARGWTTTNMRDPNAVALKLSSDAVAARKFFGMQNRKAASQSPESLATSDAAWLARNPESAKKLQAMVDEAAKTSGYNVGPVHHGTQGKNFTEFQKKGSSGTFGEAFYFTDNKEEASGYAGRLQDEDREVGHTDAEWDALKKKTSEHGRIIDAYLKIKNPMPLEELLKIPSDEVQKVAKEMGYDGFITKDDGGQTEIGVFDSSQIKSAEPITRDDSGRIIPISERFKPEGEKENDIRYMDATGLLIASDVLHTMGRQAKDLASFSKSALQKFGEWITPHLKAIWNRIQNGVKSIHGYLKNIQEHFTPAEHARLDRGSIGSKSTEAVSPQLTEKGKEALDAAGDAGKAIVRGMNSLGDWKTKSPVDKGFASPIRENAQKTSQEVQEFRDAFSKEVPQPMRRRAIGAYIESGGDEKTLDKWAKTSRGDLKLKYEAAKNLTDTEKKWADDLRSRWDSLGQKLMDYDILERGQIIDDYLPHLWQKPVSPEKQQQLKQFVGKLTKHFMNSKSRVFSSSFEGERAGFKAITDDPMELMSRYLTSAEKNITTREAARNSLHYLASDGRPLLAIAGYETETDPGADRRGKILEAPRDENTDLSGYRRIEGDHPAFRDWTHHDTDRGVWVRGDLLVHPEAYKVINNYLSKSAIRNWYEETPSTLTGSIARKMVKAADILSQQVKGSMLSLAGFHHVQLGTHALGHRISPFTNTKFDPLNDERHARWASNGLMARPMDFGERQFQEGLSGEGILSKIPGIGHVNKAISDSLWNHYLPALKIDMAEAIQKRNMELAKDDIASGKVTEDDIMHHTAYQVNEALGHQDYLGMGRNPTLQHILRLALLAPDFLEARYHFTTSALKSLTGGKGGREQGIAMATLAAGMFVGARVLNAIINNGDTKADEAPFGVVIGNRTYEMRSVPEDIYKALHDTRQFISGRLSPLIGKVGMEAITGRNYRGEKMTNAEIAKNALASPIPLSLRSVPELGNLTQTSRANPISPLEQFMGAFGIHASRTSPIKEMYSLASDWKSAHGKPDTGSYPVSKYTQLRYALEDANIEKAHDEWSKLVAEEKKQNPKKSTLEIKGKLVQGMKQGLSHPFTDNLDNEKEFVKSLSPKQKMNYKEALKLRSAIWHRLLRMTGLGSGELNMNGRKP